MYFSKYSSPLTIARCGFNDKVYLNDIICEDRFSLIDVIFKKSLSMKSFRANQKPEFSRIEFCDSHENFSLKVIF